MKLELIPLLPETATPIEILQAVAKHILEEPLRYDQTTWVRTTGDSGPACGTVCCVAGWVTFLTPKGRSRKFERYFIIAQDQLNLSIEQAADLFDTYAIYDLSRYLGVSQDLNPGSKEYAYFGVAHIERFMLQEMNYQGPTLLPKDAKEVMGLTDNQFNKLLQFDF